MLNKTEIVRYTKVTDDTDISKLDLTSQIQLLFSRVINNKAIELDASTKQTKNQMMRKASLLQFMKKATMNLDNGKNQSVTVSLSSDFMPYLDSVINNDTGLGRYYSFKILNEKELKNRLAGVRYKIVMKISKKNGDKVL